MGTRYDALPAWRKAANASFHVSLLIKQELEERLQDEVGLLLADNEALLHLEQGDLRMSDIADRLVLSRGGTTKVIDRLESMGYVSRTPDPEDRRATIVTITEAGRRIRARAGTVTEGGLERMWRSHVTDEESEAIVVAMERVLKALRSPHPED